EHAPSAAHNRLSLARNVVSKGNSWSKVVEVLVVELSCGKQIAAGRIEAVEQIVLLPYNAEIIPAHAEVQSQARSPTETVLQIKTVAVLEGVPQRIPCTLTAVAGHSLQESCQIIESQLTAKCVFDNLHDCRAPEFVSELHIVAAHFPRIVV